MYLITGASRGIGKFLFKELINRGEIVYGTYNNSLPDFESEKFFKVDVRNIEELSNLHDSIKENLEKITILNCAGNNYNAFAHKAKLDKWTDVINTNLIGSFNVIHTFLNTMREQNYGRIINFSSIVAQTGIPGTSAYAASKAGLWGLTKAIATENAKKNITINTLNLGYFDIGMITEVPEEYLNIVKSKIPSGKLGNPQDILNAVDFIVNSEYLNGSMIDINGCIV